MVQKTIGIHLHLYGKAVLPNWTLCIKARVKMTLMILVQTYFRARLCLRSGGDSKERSMNLYGRYWNSPN